MPNAAIALGTGAATTDAHIFGLRVDGTDVMRQPGNPGSIFGTDVESVVLHEIVGQPPTLEFVIDDPQSALTPTQSADVYFYDFTGRGNQFTDDLFRGIITSRELVPASGTVARKWHIVATGLEILLDRRVIPSGAIASNTSTAAALQYVMAYYGDSRISFLASPTGAINGPTLIDIGGGTITANVNLSGKTTRQALEDITRVNSLYDYLDTALAFNSTVSVDPQGRLRIQCSAFTGPWGHIYEGSAASNFAHAAPSDIAVDLDTSGVINAVYVHGVDAASSGWVTDPTSIATYGRYEAFLEAPAALTSTAFTQIGRAYLTGRVAKTRIAFRLSSTRLDLITLNGPNSSSKGWHPRQFATLHSTSGYWPENTQYPLAEVTTRYSGGGTHMELDLVYASAAKSAGSLLNQQVTDTLLTTTSGGRLAGTLGEVAVRVKAGVPTDADFDSARDGFVVVDTTNKALWMRAGGVWIDTTASGTAFPTSPLTNDLFYRTDLGGGYFWNGTRWLSTTLYTDELIHPGTPPYSATLSSHWASTALAGSQSLWIENYWLTFFIVAGTALSGANKWDLTLVTEPALTAVGSFSIASGATSTWRNSGAVAVNVLVPTTDFAFSGTATKTGTPGDIYPFARISYRLVAT